MSEQDFFDALNESLEESKNYETCMGLHIQKEGASVDLILDTARGYYSEWIKGEGGDICLYRDRDHHNVIGCHLPLYNERLVVHYDGPMRINEGFRKEASE